MAVKKTASPKKCGKSEKPARKSGGAKKKSPKSVSGRKTGPANKAGVKSVLAKNPSPKKKASAKQVMAKKESPIKRAAAKKNCSKKIIQQAEEKKVNTAEKKEFLVEASAWLENEGGKNPTVEVKIRPLVEVAEKDLRIGLHGMTDDDQWGGFCGSDKTPKNVGDGWFQVGFTFEEIAKIPQDVGKVYPVIFFTPDGDYEKAWFKTDGVDASNNNLVVSLPRRSRSILESTQVSGSGMELYLSHNPYRIATVFRIDDKNCDAPWFTELSCAGGSPARLQMWIGQFFDKLHEAYPAKERFYLTYKGTSADCRDVAEEASLASKRLGIEIRVISEPCGDPESKFRSLRKLYREAITGPYEDFHKLELNGDFKKIEDRLLSVSIMAPMKNGKSTLLNAILGQELLPNATQRCTAKISYIEHSEGMEGFEAKSIDEKGASSEYLPCDIGVLRKWNSEDSIRHVRIRGSLPGVKVDDYRLQFVDTPGPDSAVHKEDQITIERFLNDNSLPMVCYIVDRINTAEEKYLSRLKEHMSRFGKQSADRFIFVVSRMDQVEISKGDSKDENAIKTKIEDIKSDLRRLGIMNPRIFPVSAKIALKAREYRLLDEDYREEARDDIKKFWRGLRRIDSTLLDYTSVGSAIKNKIEAEITEIKKKIDEDQIQLEDNLRIAELLSGVPALEMAIEEYVTKYSVPARIYDAATIFDAGIKKANAVDLLVNEVDSRQTSLATIGENIEKLRHFLSKGEGAQEMRTTKFPEKWVESATLKKELSSAEHDFDIQIREELSNWNPQTRDKDGNITPEEARSLVKEFIGFMDKLSATMLAVYSNHVDSDARAGFKKLKADYEDKIQEILGEMPPELQEFLDKVSFVLKPNASMQFDTDALITKTTEKYIHHFRREVTMEKDGFWNAFWSVLPFTDTDTEDSEEREKTVEHVNYLELKSGVKREASLIIQDGVTKAEAAAAEQYKKLRELMMKQFDSIDTALVEFEEELKRNLSAEEGQKKKIEEYSKVLDWVKKFQEKLDHVLDLEA